MIPKLQRVINFCFLIVLFAVSSCSNIVYAIRDSSDTNEYSLKFSFSDSGYYEYIISGEPQNISFDEYNHSIIHYFVKRYNFYPNKIDSGSLMYFSFNAPYTDSAGNHSIMEYYLEWKMDAATFKSEIERLSSIYYEPTKKGSIFTSDLFDLPTYVLIYNFDSEFCYAVVNESSYTISYIYYFDIKSIDNLVFNVICKPKKLLSESDFSGYYLREYYSMYAFYGRGQ